MEMEIGQRARRINEFQPVVISVNPEMYHGMLRKRFIGSTVSEISDLADRLFIDASSQSPGLSFFGIAQKVAATLPERFPASVQYMVVTSLKQNPEYAEMNQKSFLLINLRTIIVALRRFINGRETQDDLDELLQQAFLGTLRKAQALSAKTTTKQQVYQAIGEEMEELIARGRDIPSSFVRKPEGNLVSAIRRALANGNLDEDPNGLKLVHSLAGKGDFDIKTIKRYVSALLPDVRQGALMTDPRIEVGEPANAVTQALARDRSEILAEVLDGQLNKRDSRVLKLRFGLDPDHDEALTLQEIAAIYEVTRSRIEQRIARAFMILHRPHIARKLEDYARGQDLGEEYTLREVAKTKTLSNFSLEAHGIRVSTPGIYLLGHFFMYSPKKLLELYGGNHEAFQKGLKSFLRIFTEVFIRFNEPDGRAAVCHLVESAIIGNPAILGVCTDTERMLLAPKLAHIHDPKRQKKVEDIVRRMSREEKNRCLYEGREKVLLKAFDDLQEFLYRPVWEAS